MKSEFNKIIITFDGDVASGKTYFLNKIKKLLESENFETESIFDGKEKLIVINKFNYKKNEK